MVSSNATDGSFSCNICQTVFKTKYDINRHIGTVHSSNKLQCNDCDKTFTRADNLRTHTRKHQPEGQGDPNTVEPEAKKVKATTSNAVGESSGAAPPVNSSFKCDDCRKTFTRIDNLRPHARKQHPKRPAEHDLEGAEAKRTKTEKQSEKPSQQKQSTNDPIVPTDDQ